MIRSGGGARHRRGAPLPLPAAGPYSPMLVRALSVVLLLALALPLAAAPKPRPLLWRIESPSGGKPSYLFGTIHVSDAKVAAILPSIQPALAASDAVYTEIALNFYTQMRAALAVFRLKRLSQSLPPELYRATEAELRRIQPELTLAPFEFMEIWSVALMLSVLEEQLKQPQGEALDLRIYQGGESAGKSVGGIESVDDQLDVFSEFSEAEQIEFLRATLKELAQARKSGRKPVDLLKNAYLSGDLRRIEMAARPSLQSKDGLEKRLLDRILTKRNHTMAASIARLVRATPPVGNFFAVGAGHLPGEEGLIRLLQKEGFKLERVEGAAPAQR